MLLLNARALDGLIRSETYVNPFVVCVLRHCSAYNGTFLNEALQGFAGFMMINALEPRGGDERRKSRFYK